MMAIVRESIEVDAPVAACYGIWAHFEQFPRFMSNVESVRRVDDEESVWVTRVLGLQQEWHATTLRREEGREISWQATGDVGINGRVLFTSLSPERTRIDVEMTWKGGLVKEGVVDVLGLDDATVRRDLRQFKDHAEGRHITKKRSEHGRVGLGPRTL